MTKNDKEFITQQVGRLRRELSDIDRELDRLYKPISYVSESATFNVILKVILLFFMFLIWWEVENYVDVAEKPTEDLQIEIHEAERRVEAYKTLLEHRYAPYSLKEEICN